MATPTIHRNLNTGGWSIKASASASPSHHACAVAYGVTIKQPSGVKFERCRAGGKRAVFAYFKCERIEADAVADITGMRRVRFNPHVDALFHIDGARVDSLAVAVMMADGTCWARV